MAFPCISIWLDSCLSDSSRAEIQKLQSHGLFLQHANVGHDLLAFSVLPVGVPRKSQEDTNETCLSNVSSQSFYEHLGSD